MSPLYNSNQNNCSIDFQFLLTGPAFAAVLPADLGAPRRFGPFFASSSIKMQNHFKNLPGTHRIKCVFTNTTQTKKHSRCKINVSDRAHSRWTTTPSRVITACTQIKRPKLNQAEFCLLVFMFTRSWKINRNHYLLHLRSTEEQLHHWEERQPSILQRLLVAPRTFSSKIRTRAATNLAKMSSDRRSINPKTRNYTFGGAFKAIFA